MTFAFALLLSALSGFIALSYEILWYRAFNVATGASAATFGILLGVYLLGLGLGSFGARPLCNDTTPAGRASLVRALGAIVFVANGAAFAVLPLLARALVSGWTPWPLVAVAGFFLGFCFPLIGHLGVPADDLAGVRTSYLYLSNVLGSALGSTLTGYVLLEAFPLRTLARALAGAGLTLGAALFLQAERSPLRRAGAGIVWGGALATLVLFTPIAFDDFWERLIFQRRYQPGVHFAQLAESRDGVIAITQEGTVYGGGAYDGTVNVDPRHDTNGILRAYSIAVLKPGARQVLVVGLATGAWSEVIANAPGLEHLTIVEISSAYLDLIARYPQVAPLLHNPKVTIIVDDGRRWLQRHPEARFDLIVQNTTLHWRANSTNLLSAEYLALTHAHLNSGGVLFYNTTFSRPAQRTGLSLFPHALRVGDFLAVSDAPLTLDLGTLRTVLLGYRLEGKPVLATEEDRAWLEELLVQVRAHENFGDARLFAVEDRSHLEALTAGSPIVTDDNMVVEWVRETATK